MLPGAAAKLVRKSLEEQRKKLRLQLQSERKRTTSACSSVAPSLSASDNQYLSSNGELNLCVHVYYIHLRHLKHFGLTANLFVN